jgi:hypothetical protein
MIVFDVTEDLLFRPSPMIWKACVHRAAFSRRVLSVCLWPVCGAQFGPDRDGAHEHRMLKRQLRPATASHMTKPVADANA